MYTFVPKSHLANYLSIISPKNFVFLLTINLEFGYIEVSYIVQNSKRLEIEDKTSITLVINQNVRYKK